MKLKTALLPILLLALVTPVALLSPQSVGAQTETTLTRFPTSHQGYPYAKQFENPGDMNVDDTLDAVGIAATDGAKGFDFSAIPDDATVTGLEAEVEYRFCVKAWPNCNQDRTSFDARLRIGFNTIDSNLWEADTSEPLTPTKVTVSPDTLPTVAELKNDYVLWLWAERVTGGDPVAFIDYAALRVTYDAPTVAAVNHLDADTATLEGGQGAWAPWYGSAVSRTTTEFHNGAAGLQVEARDGFWGVTFSNWPGFSATSGNKEVRLWAKKASTSVAVLNTVNVRWRDEAGTNLGTTTLYFTPTDTWTEYIATGAAPVGTTRVFVEWGGGGGSSAVGDRMFVDDIHIGDSFGSTPPPPPPPPSDEPVNTCTNPVWSTSEPNGMQNFNGFWVHNNLWNPQPGLSQTIYACSEKSWYVDASNFPDNNEAVYSYPNVHWDLANYPNGVPLSNFSQIDSTFAGKGPQKGRYNVMYDVWMNGVGWACGNTEVMVWTETFNLTRGWGTPKGTYTAPNGKVYDVFQFNDGCMNVPNYVSRDTQYSGQIDLLHLFHDGVARGIIPQNPTVSAIDYGVEFRYTAGTARFFASDFTLTCTPAC